MKIKYKYWRIDGSCVAARRRQQRGATLLPYPFDGPHRVLPLSFSVRVSQRRNTIFPTFLSPLPQGRETRFALEKKTWIFVYVYPRFTKKLVHFPIVRMEFEYFHSLFYYRREGWSIEFERFFPYRGICNLMEFAGNINKPSKRFPNWKNKREFAWTI